MAMYATLSIVGNPIVNQPSTCVLVVTNTGASTVNVTGISPKVLPVGSPVRVSAVQVAPQTANASVGGSQVQVAVLASSTATFTFQVIAYGHAVSTGTAADASGSYLIGADISADDPSYFSPVPQVLAPANPAFGQPPGSPPNVAPPAYGGELQFNRPSNTVLAL